MLAQAFEFEALLDVLERLGPIPKAERVEEIKRLRGTAGNQRQGSDAPLIDGEESTDVR